MVVISLKDGLINPIYGDGELEFIYKLDRESLDRLMINEKVLFEQFSLEVTLIYHNKDEKLFAVNFRGSGGSDGSEITESVIHNLNNIITSLHTNAYLFAKDGDKELLNEVYKGSESAVKLSRKYLSYSLIKKDRGISTIVLEEIVSDCIDIFSHKLEGLKIEIEQSFDKNISIFTNPSALYQTISSIILNSIEALKGVKGGKLSFRGYFEDGDTILEIKDNGKGFDTNDRENLFMPGFSTKKGGTGFGLYHVRDFMKRYNGDAYIDRVDNYTLVRLRFR